MTCSRCRKKFEREESRCPHCGLPTRVKGTFQTSTVLISADGEDLVYRSVDEVPPRLRTRLVRCTSRDQKSTRLNSSHVEISYAVFCLKSSHRHLLSSPTRRSSDLRGWRGPRLPFGG